MLCVMKKFIEKNNLHLSDKLGINFTHNPLKLNFLIKKSEINKKFISSKMEPTTQTQNRLATSEEEQNLKKLLQELNISDSNMPEVPKKNIKVSSFGARIRVSALLAQDAEKWIGKLVTVGGWVKTMRIQGGGDFAFVELNDGSSIKGIQVVVHKTLSNFAQVTKEGIGSCLQIRGLVVKSQGNKQPVSRRSLIFLSENFSEFYF
jgi:lysyl-tRNA synthetase class II